MVVDEATHHYSSEAAYYYDLYGRVMNTLSICSRMLCRL